MLKDVFYFKLQKSITQKYYFYVSVNTIHKKINSQMFTTFFLLRITKIILQPIRINNNTLTIIYYFRKSFQASHRFKVFQNVLLSILANFPSCVALRIASFFQSYFFWSFSDTIIHFIETRLQNTIETVIKQQMAWLTGCQVIW